MGIVSLGLTVNIFVGKSSFDEALNSEVESSS